MRIHTHIHTYVCIIRMYIYIPIQVMQAEMEQWTIKVKNAEELRLLAGTNLAKVKVGLVWPPGGVGGKARHTRANIRRRDEGEEEERIRIEE